MEERKNANVARSCNDDIIIIISILGILTLIIATAIAIIVIAISIMSMIAVSFRLVAFYYCYQEKVTVKFFRYFALASRCLLLLPLMPMLMRLHLDLGASLHAR